MVEFNPAQWDVPSILDNGYYPPWNRIFHAAAHNLADKGDLHGAVNILEQRLERMKVKHGLDPRQPEDDAFIRNDLARLNKTLARKTINIKEREDYLLKALEHANIGCSHFPSDHYLQQNAGEINYALGRHKDAITHFDTIIEQNHRIRGRYSFDGFAHSWCADCHIILGNFAAALHHAEQLEASQVSRDKSIGRHLAAIALLGLGRPEEALTRAEIQIEKTEDFISVSSGHKLAAQALIAMHRYDEALVHTRYKINHRNSTNGEIADGYKLAAYAYMGKGDYSAALTHALRRVQYTLSDPKDTGITFKLAAQALMGMNRMEEAKTYISMLLKSGSEKNIAVAHGLSIDIALKTHDTVGAKTHLESLKQVQPHSHFIEPAQARIALSEERWDDAYEILCHLLSSRKFSDAHASMCRYAAEKAGRSFECAEFFRGLKNRGIRETASTFPAFDGAGGVPTAPVVEICDPIATGNILPTPASPKPANGFEKARR